MSKQDIFLRRAKIDARRSEIGSDRKKKFDRLRTTKKLADYYIDRFKARTKKTEKKNS